MKGLFIAIVILLILVSLMCSCEQKQPAASDEKEETTNTKVETKNVQSTKNNTVIDNTAVTKVDPEVQESAQTPKPPSPEVAEAILQQIEESGVDQKTVDLGNVVQNLGQICKTSVSTQKGLLSIDFNKEAQDDTELKGKDKE